MSKWYLNTRSCPVCTSAHLSHFSAAATDGLDGETIIVRECLDCFFAWQPDPARTEADSAAIFESAYRPKSGDAAGYFNTTTKQLVAKLELAFLETLAPPGRCLLDIGGGSGAFAALAAASGWQASAVDPALSLAELSGQGVRGHRGYLDTLPWSELYDVITLWDVIEHVPEPAPFLLQVREKLSPGGLLLISTGNYKSLDRIRAGRSHWIYQHDHRWYFSPESLQCLLHDQNFQVVSSCPHSLRPIPLGHSEVSTLESFRHFLSTVKARPRQLSDAWRCLRLELKAKSWPMFNRPIFALAAKAL